ncbi:hypothetical protein PYW07_001652 [Mythimna separata]|uniref:Pyruvate kinase n=1 Tax=Mythimna separata TaxID=271217 RepID=A0AAD8DW97_MYTSE|nr:hypothetical protein PYW07_001652 [Mythimna separata]
MDVIADTIEFADSDITDNKYVEENIFVNRRSIFIVTIADPQIQLVDFEKLMEKGMNVARLKISHCTTADRIKMISRIDQATKFLAKKYGLLNEWPCGTCIELKTCITLTGLLEEDVSEILIDPDTEVTLTNNISKFDRCTKNRIFVDSPYLTTDVKIGTQLSINQDEIILVCTEKDEKSVKCNVVKGGYLANMAYVCMRGAVRSHPYDVSQKDLHLLHFAVEYQVNMVIINYVRRIDTILNIKKFLGIGAVKRPLLIAGISTQEGLMNIDDLIREADGIMLSREYLPYELEPALSNRMCLIQNYVAGKCRQAGKPFYISGDIFTETLVNDELCTREISDVTNAILQGASGFVLSECKDVYNMCSAMKILDEVCTSVEPLCINKTDFWNLVAQARMPVNAAEASAISCAVAANQTNARIIILPTVSGRTAYLLNCLRPNSIVIGVSTKIKTIRLLKICRGVVPLLYKGPPRRIWFNTVLARVSFALQYAVEQKWVDCGDSYITLEKATEESSFCDAVRIWTVTEKNKRKKIECPESYHDFNVNTFVMPPPRIKKSVSSRTMKEGTEKHQGKEKETEEAIIETEENESKEAKEHEKVAKEQKDKHKGHKKVEKKEKDEEHEKDKEEKKGKDKEHDKVKEEKKDKEYEKDKGEKEEKDKEHKKVKEDKNGKDKEHEKVKENKNGKDKEHEKVKEDKKGQEKEAEK